ncbi:hypothetical protein [Maricaulis sp.]|uniref:hypothetical protein n=1 Tax=Maricaulis sp. TaxID=1486257 RepID=UPI0032968509
MAIEWPAGLPAEPAREGFGYNLGKNGEESQTDDGPPKGRRTSTLAVDKVRLQFRWTVAQYKNVFLPWVRDDLADGNKRFDWHDGLLDTDHSAKIVGGRGGVSVRPGPGAKLTVSFELDLIDAVA